MNFRRPGETRVLCPSEGGQAFTGTARHSSLRVPAEMCGELYLDLVTFSHRYLPVAGVTVLPREDCSVAKGVKAVVYPEKHVSIREGFSVQSAVVHAYS